MKKITLVLLGASTLLAAGSAIASPYSIELGLGYAQTNISNQGSRHGISYLGAIGYQFARYFTAQITGTTFPNVGSFSKQHYAYGLNMKANLPITPFIDAFAKLGAGFTHSHFNQAATINNHAVNANSSSTNGAIIWGVGTNYHMAPHITLLAQAIGFTSNNPNPSRFAILVGMSYRF